MRRWLLALFVLQFFCSVSAFTFASNDPTDALAHTDGVVVEASSGALDTTLAGTTSSALDAVHSLLDDIPELPEFLEVSLGATATATPWATPRGQPITAWLPPALDGPQRPPRSLPAFA